MFTLFPVLPLCVVSWVYLFIVVTLVLWIYMVICLQTRLIALKRCYLIPMPGKQDTGALLLLFSRRIFTKDSKTGHCPLEVVAGGQAATLCLKSLVLVTMV